MHIGNLKFHKEIIYLLIQHNTFQQSKAIHNYVKESMNQEAKELGFDPFGNTGQEESEITYHN